MFMGQRVKCVQQGPMDDDAKVLTGMISLSDIRIRGQSLKIGQIRKSVDCQGH